MTSYDDIRDEISEQVAAGASPDDLDRYLERATVGMDRDRREALRLWTWFAFCAHASDATTRATPLP